MKLRSPTQSDWLLDSAKNTRQPRYRDRGRSGDLEEDPMASKVVITLTFGANDATLTMLDPIGPNNTWSCDPAGFLSAPNGAWSQGIASNPVMLQDSSSANNVLQFDALNMFAPAVAQKGDATSFGDGGTVPDTQVVAWVITSVS
jgi:hypothetical protein